MMRKEHERQRGRDPKRLRALSHPLRLKLISLLTEEGAATATRCAEALDESVASCSYHLNILAKYGFIGQAPGGQGRERPWQTVVEDITVSPEGPDAEGRFAAHEAIGAWLDHEFAQLEDRLRRCEMEPESWRNAVGAHGGSTFLTAEEAEKVRDEIGAIFDRYRHRRERPQLRPEGARPVRLFLALTVAPQRPRQAATAADAEG
jgi:DNA-binding transcriptional ArsR family regulator